MKILLFLALFICLVYPTPQCCQNCGGNVLTVDDFNPDCHKKRICTINCKCGVKAYFDLTFRKELERIYYRTCLSPKKSMFQRRVESIIQNTLQLYPNIMKFYSRFAWTMFTFSRKIDRLCEQGQHNREFLWNEWKTNGGEFRYGNGPETEKIFDGIAQQIITEGTAIYQRECPCVPLFNPKTSQRFAQIATRQCQLECAR